MYVTQCPYDQTNRTGGPPLPLEAWGDIQLAENKSGGWPDSVSAAFAPTSRLGHKFSCSNLSLGICSVFRLCLQLVVWRGGGGVVVFPGGFPCRTRDSKLQISPNPDHPSRHGCRWETFYMFACCGLVGNPHLTAIFFFFAPLPTSTNQRISESSHLQPAPDGSLFLMAPGPPSNLPRLCSRRSSALEAAVVSTGARSSARQLKQHPIGHSNQNPGKSRVGEGPNKTRSPFHPLDYRKKGYPYSNLSTGGLR